MGAHEPLNFGDERGNKISLWEIIILFVIIWFFWGPKPW